MKKEDLPRTLASALDGDEQAAIRLTRHLVTAKGNPWPAIIEAAAVSALEAAELAKMPPAIRDSHCLGLGSFVRLVRSQRVSDSIAKRICNFVHRYC